MDNDFLALVMLI